GDRVAAVKELETVAQAPESPAFDHAKALLGQFNFANSHYEEAIKYWQSLDSSRRATWHLDEPLRATVFLSALLALEAGDFAQAASRLREAGRLGYRDRRMGGLLIQALVQEGKRLLREAGNGSNGAAGESSRENLDSAVRVFEQALNAGARQPEVAYLLALAYKRQGKLREARAAFRKIAQPD